MKILLLNSGGLDSALVAKKLKDDGHELGSLFIRFVGIEDQAKRSTAAKETAARYCTEHIEAEIGIPEARLETDTKTVPATTEICLAIGRMYAKHLGYEAVVGGFKGNIQTGYTEAYNKLEEFNIHNIKRIPIMIPLEGMMEYSEALEWANAQAEDFAYTFSCDCGNIGTCGKCTQRTELGV